MKTTLTFCLSILISINVWSQNIFEIKGKIQRIAYHQGGIELPPEHMAPFALGNFTMFVVKYNGDDLKPTILKKIKSDSSGNFTLNLPSGQYGFLLSNKSKDLHPGAYLPKMKQNEINDNRDIIDFDMQLQHDYWYLNVNGPLEVGPNSTNQVIITHYNVSICYMCP